MTWYQMSADHLKRVVLRPTLPTYPSLESATVFRAFHHQTSREIIVYFPTSYLQ